MQHDSPPNGMSQNGTDSPLFRADTATLTFAAQKDGKIRVISHCIAKDYLSVAPGETFEVRLGPQGVEGRVVTRVVPPPVDEPDPFWVGAERADALQTLSAAGGE